MKKANPLRRASALITTLLVVTLLTIIVVAFLQSMSIESKTAKSFSNIQRAKFAAEAAQLEATSRVASLMTANPYHAIGYTNIVSSGSTSLVPVLFGAPSGAAATSASGAPKNYYLYSVTNATVAGTAPDGGTPRCAFPGLPRSWTSACGPVRMIVTLRLMRSRT